MVDPVTLNARKPGSDENGLAMLHRMNERHQPLYQWGLDHISLDTSKSILDIGFGGGQNIKNLCMLAPQARISGIDYSEASYHQCADLNKEEIGKGIVDLQIGSAEALPYDQNSFDLATAFETIYYWPNIGECFKNVYRVLKSKGAFLICNEDCSSEGIEEIAGALDMNFYKAPELENLFREAGFRTVHVDMHTNGKWICAVGIKD